MTPRIVLLSEVFPPRQGGSGRWLWELYRRLELPVRVVAGTAAGAEAFDRAAPFAVDRLAEPFAAWGWRGARTYLRAARQLARACSAHDATVVHSARCLPEGLVAWLAARRTGIPFWCFAHGEELTLAETSRELSLLTRWVLGAAQHLVANSANTKDMLVGRWRVPASRVTVHTPGVDTGRFTPAPRDEAIRTRLGWSGRQVILTVGALQQRKGQDMLIRALPAIRHRCPAVLYAIAGEGWERDRLEKLARECGVSDIVQFRGSPDDDAVVDLYRQSDLFALPNRRVGWDIEGFGIVLLEAQSCGIPVVAGRSGGTAETLVPGETGEVVDCDAPGDLADVCISLLRDATRRARLGAAGRRWATERFDWRPLVRAATALFVGRR